MDVSHQKTLCDFKNKKHGGDSFWKPNLVVIVVTQLDGNTVRLITYEFLSRKSMTAVRLIHK